MNILLLGGGGREHALAWKLAQSPSVARLYAAPGNPGIAAHAQLVELDPDDHDAAVRLCRQLAVDLVVVGPEGPLVGGLVDRLRRAGIAAFGPTAAAARLEGSKAFTKALCAKHGIPTAAYAHCHSLREAVAALDGFAVPVVVKADGLAAGKGVTIATTRAQAEQALAGLFSHAAAEVVIEEFLAGEEVSLFVLCDGVDSRVFASAQDHKRIGEGDTGPNTGGMGAYSPARVLTLALEAQAMRDIVQPTIAAMAERGTPFVGMLFAGLMLTDQGPRLIEYNVRFGDPETQAMLPRFEGDLGALLLAVATGRLAQVGDLAFSPQVAVNVVVAAPGYPGPPRLGDAVSGLGAVEDATVFIAGVTVVGDAHVTSGGRVLSVTALGHDIGAARGKVYAALEAIVYPQGQWRRDIGWRELARIEGALT